MWLHAPGAVELREFSSSAALWDELWSLAVYLLKDAGCGQGCEQGSGHNLGTTPSQEEPKGLSRGLGYPGRTKKLFH